MSHTRAADGTGTPVPVVPPSAGPRISKTRRSWLRRRPAGPWVLRSRGQVGAFTHAWWRKTS